MRIRLTNERYTCVRYKYIICDHTLKHLMGMLAIVLLFWLFIYSPPPTHGIVLPISIFSFYDFVNPVNVYRSVCKKPVK